MDNCLFLIKKANGTILKRSKFCGGFKFDSVKNFMSQREMKKTNQLPGVRAGRRKIRELRVK
jgi:hypothetical protein